METARPRRRAALVAGLVVAVAVIVLVPGGDVGVYTAAQVGAAVTLGRAVVARRREAHPAWWLVAAGVASWVVADVWWLLTNGIGEKIAWDSPAGAFFALEYACLIAAMAWFAVSGARRDLDASLDVVAVVVAMLFTVWELVIEPSFADSAVSIGDRLSSSGYAVADVVLAGLGARLLLVPGARSPALHRIVVGCLVMALADIGYAVSVQTGDYAGASLVLGPCYIFTAWLLASAARHPSMPAVGRPPATTGAAPLHATRMAMCVGALVLPIPVAVVAAVVSDGFDVASYLVTTSTLMVVAGLRLTRLLSASERLRTELASREAYYRAMAQHSSDGVLVVDPTGRVLDASPSAASILGFGRVVVGIDALSYVEDVDRERIARTVTAALGAAGEVYVTEARIRRGDGTWGWFELRASNLLEDDAVGGVVVNIHDITDRKAAEQELEHQAFHDVLTGLANRGLFHDRVGHALARTVRDGGVVAVLFCDLDGFKTVNDSLGHGAGDRLLEIVATRIAGVVRDGDSVARLGGDEFAVLLEGHDAAGRADRVATRVLEAVQEPVVLDGHVVAIGISIGVALAAADATTTEGLLRDADTAMYRAKAAGKGRVVHFEPAMRVAAVDRLALEAGLRGAAARGELELRLQPIVTLASGEVAGFEALVRWRHPERGLLAPGAFLPLAEETGLVVELGEWVLHAATAVAVSWPGRLDVAVNVSARELDDPAFTERVGAALDASGLDAGRLVLEVTETAMVADPDGVAARLAALKELGVRIAVDDFGTGYSALQYLRRFPVDILKIDRSFVEAVDDGDLPAIVRGLIGLGQVLDLELLAEGIERREQLDALVAGGCALGQGYLLAEPLTVDDAHALVASAARLPLAPAGADTPCSTA